MERLQIGKVIYKLRKEKGLTQDQLANFVGVSTAAVSKWESELSYPDITLLPVLATLFNISIDRLLNFKIELSTDEVMKIYCECEALFSKGSDFDKAMEVSKNYILKYQGSYSLKFRIEFLFIVYSWQANNEEKNKAVRAEGIKLFEDIALNSEDTDLVEGSLFQLGALYSEIGEEDKEFIDIINEIKELEKSFHMTKVILERPVVTQVFLYYLLFVRKS